MTSTGREPWKARVVGDEKLFKCSSFPYQFGRSVFALPQKYRSGLKPYRGLYLITFH